MDERTGMPRVGMVGGGQLARMTHQAAIPLGQTLRVLSVAADDSAALVTPDVMLGHHTDLEALRAFARQCDVVTFDHEHVPGEHIRTLVAEGHAVYPGADALQYAQDKALMRNRLAALGAPVPAFAVIDAADPDRSDRIREFGDEHGWPCVVKTARGGYDGRGVWVIRSAADLDAAPDGAPADLGLPGAGHLVLEAFVPMRRELAAVVARSPFGQAAAWPVVQTVQSDGICVEVIAPAPGLDDDRAAAAGRLALRIAGELGVVGVLAVELFEVDPGPAAPDGLLVNELAMRPHNSGHWSMDGSVTGQFEQHLRAVLDYPLGRTDLLAPFTVMGNVLGGPADGPGAGIGLDERVHHLAARFPQVKVHLYGKAFRPGRKLGHVNVLGSDLGELRRVAGVAATWLSEGVWADGWDAHAADPRPARQEEAVLS
ncbi:5-(carboxyamino)imidazole ribonucleotide synthase [Nakamurella sp.]|uniref:5-(carboxyamino)imidazole ribonucleotide synthase n=1 Tax=Nakamurella sp. TaxID=1869182 RepID=UPI003B3B6049